jgi:hypothetical protein
MDFISDKYRREAVIRWRIPRMDISHGILLLVMQQLVSDTHGILLLVMQQLVSDTHGRGLLLYVHMLW